MARILATIAVFFLLLPIAGQAQDDPTGGLTKADQATIRQVINAQLTALQHDDGPLAFSYSTPLIREKFGTAENFLEMVKIAYPSVYRPRDIQFRELEATENGPVQKVFFFASDAEPLLGLYFMEKEPDGSWKINGCELAPAPDISI